MSEEFTNNLLKEVLRLHLQIHVLVEEEKSLMGASFELLTELDSTDPENELLKFYMVKHRRIKALKDERKIVYARFDAIQELLSLYGLISDEYDECFMDRVLGHTRWRKGQKNYRT